MPREEEGPSTARPEEMPEGITQPSGGGFIPPLFDTGFTLARLGIWSVRKELTVYAGPCCQVMIAAVPTDVAFADVTTVAANNYELIKIYDQSGNGKHLEILETPTPTLSLEEGTPIFDASGGGAFRALGFTDSYRRVNLNFFFAASRGVSNTGHIYLDNAGASIYTGGSPDPVNGNVYCGGWNSNRYAHINLPGTVYHHRFRGGQATDALQSQFLINGTALTAISTGAQFGLFSETTNLDINGNVFNGEYFGGKFKAIYYVGELLTDLQVATITASMGSLYSAYSAKLLCEGDSLTSNSANGGAGSANSYPNLLTGLLETETASNWDVVNAGVTSAQIGIEMLADQETQVARLNYYWAPHDIKVIWGATNDLIGVAAATVLGYVTTYFNNLIDRGHDPDKLYFLNVIPRNDLGGTQATWDARRTTFNAGIAAALPSGVHLVDVAGADAWALNTTLFIDEGGVFVHLNNAGNALVAQKVFDVIQLNF